MMAVPKPAHHIRLSRKPCSLHAPHLHEFIQKLRLYEPALRFQALRKSVHGLGLNAAGNRRGREVCCPQRATQQWHKHCQLLAAPCAAVAPLARAESDLPGRKYSLIFYRPALPGWLRGDTRSRGVALRRCMPLLSAHTALGRLMAMHKEAVHTF